MAGRDKVSSDEEVEKNIDRELRNQNRGQFESEPLA